MNPGHAGMTSAELTEARETLHLSQVELARILDVHPNLINRWERGISKPPRYLRLIFKYCDYWAMQAELTGRWAHESCFGPNAEPCSYHTSPAVVSGESH